MSANIATFEQYIKQSEESQGGVVTVLRQGWLLKRSSNMRKEWKRRFFVLDSLGMLYYYSNKVNLGFLFFSKPPGRFFMLDSLSVLYYTSNKVNFLFSSFQYL